MKSSFSKLAGFLFLISSAFLLMPVSCKAIHQGNGNEAENVDSSKTEVTVTFVVDEESSNLKGYEGEALTKPADPSKEGYSFAGWQPAVPEKFPSKNTTYTATWTINKYTVSFDTNNAEGSGVASISKDYGTEITLPSIGDNTKAGYSFVGWSENKDATNGSTTTYVVKNDVTLYAIWSEKPVYKITYVTEKGLVPASVNVVENSVLTAAELPVLEATGYLFEGWYFEDTKITSETSYAVTSSIILNAKWSASPNTAYSVEHYQQNLNDDGYTVSDTENLTGTTDTDTAAEARSYTGFTAQEFSQTKISADGSATVKIYYTRNSYSKTLSLGGGSGIATSISGKYDAVVSVDTTNLNRTGYTFAGWSPSLPQKYTGEDSTVYTAQWTANQYKVSFNANGGTGTMSNQIFTFGIAQNLSSNSFTKTGYTFAGWATSKDNAASYSNGASYTIGAADVTLYAVWAQNGALSISYYNVEGAQNSNPSTFLETENISLVDASKTGYTFAGWVEGSDGTGSAITGWNAGEKNSAVSLYALWTANTNTAYKVEHYQQNLSDEEYTISDTDNLTGTTAASTSASAKSYTGFSAQDFVQSTIAADGSTTVKIYYNRIEYTLTLDLAGGSGISTTVSGKYGTPVSVNTTSLSKAGYTFSGWSPSLPSTFASNGTYTAQWTANEYKVSFDANGGTGSMTDQTFTYGVSQNLKTNTFTRTGYTFSGWATSSSGSVNYTDQVSYTIGNGNVTLYAVWTENDAHSIVYYNVEGAVNTNPSSYKETETVTLISPAKTGYTFEAWYAGTDATGSVITGWNAGEKTGTVSLFAKWTPNTSTAYTVNHYKEALDGTYTEISETDNLYGTTEGTTSASAKSYAGFVVQDFVQSTIAADGSTVVSIYYKRSTISLTLDLAGGSGISTTVSGKYGAAVSVDTALLSKAGYTFAGWSPSLPLTFASNGTYTAQWTANQYKVSFNANGGTGSMTAQTFTYGVSQNLKANTFTRSDYEFTGWAVSASDSSAYADGAEYSIGTSDVTLYAVWTALTNYTITYNNAEDATNTNVSTFKKTDTVSLTSPSKTGYTFVAWHLGTSASGSVTTGWSAGTYTENISLYAEWAANTNTAYVVKHYQQNISDDNYTLSDTDILTGTTAASTSATAKSYTGFNALSFSQGTIAADGSTVVEIYYTRKTITLTLNLDGGSGTSTVSGRYGAAVSVTDPVKSGYTFSGWSPSLPSTFASNGTYTALWTTGSVTVTLQSVSDITVESSTDSTSVTLTAASGYDSYVWYVNGVLDEDETSNEYTFSTSSLKANVYQIMVVASKDGIYYSCSAQVKVE